MRVFRSEKQLKVQKSSSPLGKFKRIRESAVRTTQFRKVYNMESELANCSFHPNGKSLFVLQSLESPDYRVGEVAKKSDTNYRKSLEFIPG